MSKRGNGEGTIYRRTDGRYEARVSLPGGQRKSYYGRTRADVARAMTVALREAQLGRTPQDETLTVSHLLRTWLQAVQPSVRPRTYTSYELHVRLYLEPALGRLRVSKLKPAHVQQLINAKLEDGLSPRTVELMGTVLKSALKHGVVWGHIHTNPAQFVKRPRPLRPKVDPLTVEEARTFLSHIEGDRLEAMYWLALSLGLRLGEILGLYWEDVLLDRGTVEIRRTLLRTGGCWQIAPPKSESSRRTLALPHQVARRIALHKERQAVERESAADWPWPALVFTTTKGTPLDGTNVTRYFQRHLANAGLRRQRFHDLRHAAASFLLATGGGLHEVKEILGHSQIGLTVDTYGHLELGAKRQAAARIDDLLTQSASKRPGLSSVLSSDPRPE